MCCMSEQQLDGLSWEVGDTRVWRARLQVQVQVLPTLLMAQAVFSRILPLLVRRILEKSWRAARR